MKAKKITAISSYYKSEIHPQLFKHKQILTEKILDFFESKIRDLIPYDDAIFDIGFILPEK